MPFLALRSYLPAGHPDKGREIGSEATPAAFLDTLLRLTAEWRRVLAPHGSICVELGDTYAGSGGAGGDYDLGGIRDGQAKFNGSALADRKNKVLNAAGQRMQQGNGWPRAKSLCGIPHLYHLSLAYGRNLLTGQPSPAGDWLVRNVVAWCRPNPPVGALGDKFRPGTSYLTIACTSSRRYFDLDAVRTPAQVQMGRAVAGNNIKGADGASHRFAERIDSNPAGAPPLDWWEIPTQPYPGAHYACVDDQTEALTPDGWKRHDQLHDGDAIAAYDADRGVIVWQFAAFHRYPFDGDLVAIEKRETSQRLTPNHRVLHQTRAGTVATRRADEAVASWRVPVAAPFATGGEGPGEVKAALLGWYVTEGGRRAKRVYLYQSESANPKHCARIRDLLDATNASYVERRRVRPIGATMSPRESVEVSWSIEGTVAAWLIATAPGKVLPAGVMGWSEAECSALLDALIAGDGHERANGRRTFIQNSRETIDNVQALCSRLGLRSTISARLDGAWSLTIGERRWLSLRGTNGSHAPIGREHYTGTVWCPSVPATYWLARRNGRPFITGNTFPAALCTRPILAMCPRRVCLTCGEPSRRVVEAERHQPQGSEPSMVARQQGDKHGTTALSAFPGNGSTTYITLGWTDCGHGGAWRNGLVLDPFAGSGTTLAVATGHGRDAIGIDLDARNADLARDRVGMFLDVDAPVTDGAA